MALNIIYQSTSANLHYTVRRVADRLTWDPSTNTFTASPTTASRILLTQDADVTNYPGLFWSTTDTTGWSNGQYLVIIGGDHSDILTTTIQDDSNAPAPTALNVVYQSTGTILYYQVRRLSDKKTYDPSLSSFVSTPGPNSHIPLVRDPDTTNYPTLFWSSLNTPGWGGGQYLIYVSGDTTDVLTTNLVASAVSPPPPPPPSGPPPPPPPARSERAYWSLQAGILTMVDSHGATITPTADDYLAIVGQLSGGSRTPYKGVITGTL